MLTHEEAIEIFKSTHALLSGHFKLTSGRHSNQYMQCAQVLQYPHYAAKLCASLAEHFAAQKVDVVVGPAMGGIVVAYEVARALGVRSIFTEREQGVMTLRRGFALGKKEKVLVVEDVITTGGSVKEVIEVVKATGAEIVGVGVLVDRSNGQVDFGLPTEAIVRLDIKSFPPEDCPLCKEGQPVTKPGSRNS